MLLETKIYLALLYKGIKPNSIRICCRHKKTNLNHGPLCHSQGQKDRSHLGSSLIKYFVKVTYNIHSVKPNCQIFNAQTYRQYFIWWTLSPSGTLPSFGFQDTSFLLFFSLVLNACDFPHFPDLSISCDFPGIFRNITSSLAYLSQLHCLITFMHEPFPNLNLSITSESCIQLPWLPYLNAVSVWIM